MVAVSCLIAARTQSLRICSQSPQKVSQCLVLSLLVELHILVNWQPARLLDVLLHVMLLVCWSYDLVNNIHEIEVCGRFMAIFVGWAGFKD